MQRKRLRYGGARGELLAFALWGTAAGVAAGAAAGCAAPGEEREGAGLGKDESQGAVEQGLTGQDCPDTLASYVGQLERDVFCKCTDAATAAGDVYGTDLYDVGSSLCRAAVHAGAILMSGGHRHIRATLKPITRAVGSFRFGIQSGSLSESSGSLSFLVEGMEGPAPVTRRWVPMAFYAKDGTASTTTSDAAAWRTSFAVHNPSAVTQIIAVKAYDGLGRYERRSITLPPGGATSFQLDAGHPQGGDIPPDFKGAVVLEGSTTFEVTAVQIPVNSSVVNRPIVNAVARTSRALHFPMVRRHNDGRSTRLFFLNPRASADTLKFTFRDTSGTLRCESSRNLGPFQSATYDLATYDTPSETGFPGCELPSSWTGTLTVETTTQLGRFVGAALLVDKVGRRVSAYEGIEALPGDGQPYFPSVLRRFQTFGSTTSSAFELQRLGDPQSYLMQYTHRDTGQVSQRPGWLESWTRADTSTLDAGFIGSASYFGSPVAGVAVTTRDDGEPSFEAVSPGIYTSAGTGTRLSLPYVRWSTASFGDAMPRTHIAIQNLSGLDLPVRVTYYRADGTVAGVHAFTILMGRKANSSPAEAGLAELGYAPSYGGSATVESVNGQGQLGAVVRTVGATLAEDSTGIPIPAASELVWPNATSFANSDPWLAANHQAIRQLRPKVLVLNFVNGFSNALGKFQQVADAYRIATRYHARTDPSPLPVVDFQLAKIVDLADATPPAGWPFENSAKFPRSSTTAPFGGVDYARFFSPTFAAHYGYPNGAGGYHDLCALIDRGLIHELWFVASQDVPDSVPAESLESKQRYDGSHNRIPGSFDRCAGNGCFAASVPVCGRSVRIAFINYRRGAGCFLESLGHSFEGMALYGSLPYLRPYFRELGMFDLDTRYSTPFASWYACPDGTCLTYSDVTSTSMRVDWNIGSQSGTIPVYTPACGNAHFSPNSRGHYDMSNSQVVPSTCAHFRMKDGPNGTDRIEPYASADLAAFSTLAPDCTGAWQVYWRQNFPGLDNRAKDSSGGPMRNWWPFLYY